MLSIGSGDAGRPRIGALAMLLALVLAAFLGGALGLVWQSASFFAQDSEDEVLTVEAPSTGG